MYPKPGILYFSVPYTSVVVQKLFKTRQWDTPALINDVFLIVFGQQQRSMAQRNKIRTGDKLKEKPVQVWMFEPYSEKIWWFYYAVGGILMWCSSALALILQASGTLLEGWTPFWKCSSEDKGDHSGQLCIDLQWPSKGTSGPKPCQKMPPKA